MRHLRMQWRKRLPPDELDERYFPLAFVSRYTDDGCAVVHIRIFDPSIDEWRFITLDQWRAALATARSAC